VEIQHSMNTGTYVEPSRVTVGQFLDQWLNDIVATKVAPSTAQVNEHIVRCHLIPSLRAASLAKLTSQQVQVYYVDRLENGRLDRAGGLSHRSVRHHHTTLHTALQSALKQGLLGRNVLDAVDPPRSERKEMRTLDEVGLRRIIQAAAETLYHALFYTALFTGARRSELLALSWSDIDLDVGGVLIARSVHHLKHGKIVYKAPKTNKSRRHIPLPPSATRVLRMHKDRQQEAFSEIEIPWTEDRLVFGNEVGGALHPDTVTHARMKLVRGLGLKEHSPA